MNAIRLLILTTVFCFFSRAFANTEPDDYFNYVGILMNPSGSAIRGVKKEEITIDLYSEPAGGTSTYSQTFTDIAVHDGVFELKIGPVLPNLREYRYMGLRIGNRELKGRVELSTEASSVVAMTAMDSERFAGMDKNQFLDLIKSDIFMSMGFITHGSVTEEAIADEAITESKIRHRAITAEKIADNAVTADKIADGTITAEKLSFVPQTHNDRLTEISGLPMKENHFIVSDGQKIVASSPAEIGSILGLGNLAFMNDVLPKPIDDGAIDTAAIKNGAITTEKLSFLPQVYSERLTEISTMTMMNKHFIISDGRGLVTSSTADIRSLLGLNLLASKDIITGSDIENNSITANKLNSPA